MGPVGQLAITETPARMNRSGRQNEIRAGQLVATGNFGVQRKGRRYYCQY